MILTCPNCYSQYKIGLAVMGNRGRDVRCTACGEVWHEDDHVVVRVEQPVDNNVENDTEFLSAQDILDIPESIKPTHDDAENKGQYGAGTDKKISYAIAATIFLCVLSYLLLSSASMMRDYPSMQGFYALFGIQMEIPDSGKVAFANIKAAHHDGIVKVSGDIVNLTDDPQTLYMLEVTIGEGADGQPSQWFAVPPKLVLGPEETITFKTESHLEQELGQGEDGHEDAESSDHEPTQSDDVQYVTVRFVLKPALKASKTDEADDENIPVPHEIENDHQSDHAASL